MKGLPGSMAQLMKQANQMQLKIKKAQEELAQKEYEATSGGGAVTVKANGEYQLVSIAVSPEVMKSEDVEMLQDLILTAVNEAIKTARTETNKQMEKITGGVGMPGIF